MKPESIPLVSVVAVCFNHSKFVKETLNSIIQQTYKDIQLIILDDQSSDGSVGVINDWISETGVGCKFIAHSVNKGLCATLNEALTYCQGEYLQLIACDDVLHPEKIELQVKELEWDSGIALVCSDFSSIDEKGDLISEFHYARDYQFPADPFIAILDGSAGYKRVIHSPTVLLRKEVVDDIGGWDENLLQEDFYMWMHITFRHKVVFMHQVLVKYRVLASSLSSVLTGGPELKQKYLEGHLNVIDRFIGTAVGQRQKVLVLGKLNRLEQLERNVLDSSNDQLEIDKDMAFLFDQKESLISLHGLENSLFEKSVAKTIKQLWQNGMKVTSRYSPYTRALELKVRVLMSLGIQYKTIKNLRRRKLH